MAARVFWGGRALMAASRGAAAAEGGASSAGATGKAKGGSNSGGLMKALPVSPAMKKFLGVPEISRSEAVKKIWDYIKLHELQVAINTPNPLLPVSSSCKPYCSACGAS